MKINQDEALKAKFSDTLGSSRMLVSTISEWYEAKHRKPSSEEVEFINSIPIESCPYCESSSIRKDGRSKKTGLATMECKDCGRKFNPLTGTIFDSRKIPFSEWVEFLVHIFQFHSIRTSSFDNRNAEDTGFYWLSKVFAVVDGFQDGTILSGRVWIDETYFPRWKTESISSDGKLLRGLSRNQYCVCSATDGKLCRLSVCGVGKPSGTKAINCYCKFIAKGSTIIHDGDRSYGAFIESMGLASEVHTTLETKGLPDNENPMDPINRVHRYLSGFIGAHRGFLRDELRNWLNLFCFYWNTPGDAFQKAQSFIEIAVKKRVIIRYRDWKNTKSNDGY